MNTNNIIANNVNKWKAHKEVRTFLAKFNQISTRWPKTKEELAEANKKVDKLYREKGE